MHSVPDLVCQISFSILFILSNFMIFYKKNLCRKVREKWFKYVGGRFGLDPIFLAPDPGGPNIPELDPHHCYTNCSNLGA